MPRSASALARTSYSATTPCAVQAGPAAGCFAFPFSSAADAQAAADGTSGGGPPGVLTLYSRGRMSSDELQDMLEASWRGSQRLAAFLRQSIQRAFAPAPQ